VQGTSFSSPEVAGVLALMKGEDPHRRLSRERLVTILKSTASYEGLSISDEDASSYRSKAEKSDLDKDKQYFFGSGLVNADAAIRAVKHR